MGLIITPRRRWTAYPNYFHGAVGSLGAEGERFERLYPAMMPGEWPGRLVTVASDYGGGANLDFDSYSFLLAGDDGLVEFQNRMASVRTSILTDGRSISFKDRNDRLQQRAEPAFLEAANQIPGVLATILVDHTKAKLRIFGSQADVVAQGSAEVANSFLKLKPPVFERFMRVVVFGTTLAAGLARTDQTLFWVTDNDDIVANKGAAQLFGKSVGALRGGMQAGAELLVRTTSPSGWPTPAKRLMLEDLLSVADYAAGVLPVAVTAWQRDGHKWDSPLVHLMPESLPNDIRGLMRWFGDDRWPLKRWVFVTKSTENDKWSFGSLRIGRYAALVAQ